MADSQPLTGQTVSHYRILEKLAGGGMGVVYKAEDTRLHRFVALKFLPDDLARDPQALVRFQQEAEAASALNHPNICTIYDIGEQEGRAFIAMEFLEGQTLKQCIASETMKAEQVIKYGMQIAEALDAAHPKKIVHLDIKPANLFLTERDQIKVLDFGLAKLLRPVSDATVTEILIEPRAVAGTLPYMAPEQLRGESVDVRTDIYALGAVLYEMATGQRPFRDALATNLCDAILNRPPPPPSQFNPNLSLKLEDVILKCLEKEPNNRYQSAKELAVDLRRLAMPSSVAATMKPAIWTWRRPALAAGYGAVGLLVLVTILLELNVGGLHDRLSGNRRRPKIQSLAVLPLNNLSGDPGQEYFADGMTEALITELGKISALRVISRQSTTQYKGTKKSVPQIARELMVDAVVEGSVLREGDRVRVSVQLIEAAPERHLWADSYDREMRDVLALDGEMARTVAKEIKVTLTPQEEIRLAGTRAVNPAASEAYFRGRYFLDRLTKGDFDKALADFQQAIELEPTFAPAYASLAEVYLALALYDPTHQTELMAKAQAASLKALELDDKLSAAHYTLASQHSYIWDWTGTEVEDRRAIELNPSNALAHVSYASLLMILGRMTEAEVEFQRAEELDPVSLEIYAAATAFFYYARRYDEFIEHCQDWPKRNPNLEWNYHHCLGAAYVQMGRHEEAIAELREALKSSSLHEHTATELANALAVAGKPKEALKVLDQVENVPWRTFGAALVQTALGEKDEAFRSLERAIELRAPFVTLLKVDPRFDSLHKDPRFQNLLRRMNLPE
jgi:eukaryotic-like serine/threonine-protein kinase